VAVFFSLRESRSNEDYVELRRQRSELVALILKSVLPGAAAD